MLGRAQNTERGVVSVGSLIRRPGAVMSPALVQMAVRGRSVPATGLILLAGPLSDAVTDPL